MFFGRRKLVAVALFTLLLVVMVNASWWAFYDRTKLMLDRQLSRRLLATARAAASAMAPETTENLVLGDLEAYAAVTDLLEAIRASDSLAELFILDESYRYVMSTSLEADSIYFLAELNGPHIDSLLFGASPEGLATPSYKTGDFYLKSAFAPLRDGGGYVVAVLGVEASVDYFDDLVALQGNLFYSGILSILGGAVLGLLFLLLQQRLNRTEQRLFVAETHTYMGRMVAVLSHEIRNPLMIIRAAAERLVKKQATEEGRFIIEESDRLNGLATGYLDLAKAGGSMLAGEQPEMFRLSDLAASLKRHLHEAYGPADIDWIEHPIPAKLALLGYRRSLRQVLLNLLINGAEACLAVSRPIRIGLEVTEHANTVDVRVIDHGEGLTRKELKRVATPFYTTKPSGSGLGLHLSQRIVAEMGGELAIRSRAGEGTVVGIRLPKRPKE